MVFIRTPHRRGVALPIFVIFLFVLLGLAALVIDVGLARATQRQMQAAADMAAVEGLRFADLSPSKLADATWLSTQGIDESELLAYTGPRPDSTLDPFAPDAAWQTWLSRAQELVPRLQARQLLRRWLTSTSNADSDFETGFGPIFESTTGAGTVGNIDVTPYRPTDSDGNLGLELNLPSEVGTDQRDDAGDISLVRGTATEALIVRLRRTGAEPVAGQQTAGPLLPPLFRMQLGDPTNPRWPAAVAAQGTARLQPVRTVGPATSTRLGAAPFWLTETQLTTGTVSTTTLQGQTFPPAGIVALGDTLPGGTGILSSAGEGFVPLVATTATPIVNAFAWVAWRTEGTSVRVQQVGRIAPENASAITRGPHDAGRAVPLTEQVLLAPVRAPLTP